MTAEPAATVLRRPNLIIAGVSKAGTTSLFNYLGQHPDVGTSDVKELRFFTPVRYGEPLPPLEDYLLHFRGCLGRRYAVEATPGYFYGGGPLARAIDDTCPDVRVVVSLRDPVQRCWSWYRFVKSRLRIPEQMGFEEYVDRCEDLHRQGVDGRLENQPYWGLGGGCYDTWLPDWVDALGERFRLVFFEDLVADPCSVVTGLCRWLDLDDTPVPSFAFDVENVTVHYRNRLLQRAAVTVNRHGERFFRRHTGLKRRLRRGYYAVNRGASEAMAQPVRRRLEEFYAPHNRRLEHQLAPLGMSLPESWTGRGR